MKNSEIIAKANEVVKDANFTKIIKARKNAGVGYLIVACANGLGIYGSYSSNTIYANYSGQMMQLS